MRLFIASPIILTHYASIIEDFKDIIEGKWVEEENLHLTWVFLGAVEDQKSIVDKLKNITPLKNEIGIKKLGFFGRPPKVFFAKTEEKMLDEKIKEFKTTGFDLYSFKPHITLCHIKTIHNYKAYRETLKTYRDKTLGHILPEINLYESTFTPKGTQYACRHKIEKFNLIQF